MNREFFKNYIDNLPVGISRIDIHANEKIFYNKFFLNMVGWEAKEIDTFDKWFSKAYPNPKYRQEVLELWDKIAKEAPNKSFTHSKPIEIKIVCKNGKEKWVEARYYKSEKYIHAIFTDVTALHHSSERLTHALTGSSDGLWDWTMETNEVYYSPRWFEMLGYTNNELPQSFTTWENLMDPTHLEPTKKLIQNYLEGKSKDFNTEFRMKHKNGHWVHILARAKFAEDDKGNLIEPKKLAGTHVDISERKQHQEKLEYLAHYDALTDLPNKILLLKKLEEAIENTKENNTHMAIIYLDLDGFKEINDLYTHNRGDQFLIETSNKLKKVLRKEDLLARIGGDEFIIVLNELENVQSSITLIENILNHIYTPIKINNSDVNVSASLGVSFYPQLEKEIDAEHLIRQADQAMYIAKQDGKNCFHIFDNKQDLDIRKHHEKIQRIKKGLQNDEFQLYYQPKVNLSSGEIIGVEALIRWNHPEDGTLLPINFLPLLQNQKEMVLLGEWVLNAAMKQVENWLKKGINLTISVNIDGYHLQKEDFLQNLQNTLKRHPLVKPEHIELEVLETSALEDIKKVSQIMYEAQKLGFSFAIDDFGTGYSSLVYLKQLPAKTLKIDKSFVLEMLENTDDLAILDGILGLSNIFGRQVVAEGMESMFHGEILLRMGCKIAQGFAIAKPMKAEDFVKWFSNEWKPDKKMSNINSLNRDDVGILYAALQHRVWINNIITYLEKKCETLQHQEGETYKFKEWLKKDINKDIRELHDNLHDFVDNLFVKCKEKECKSMQENLAKLVLMRDDLVNAILKELDKNSILQ